MSEIVFILGAGASADAGAPLMGNFLEKAEDLLRSGMVPGQLQPDFQRTIVAIEKLQCVHSKSQLDLFNIESVFAAFEIAKLIDRLPGLEAAGKEIDSLLSGIRTVISTTIEETIHFKVGQRTQRPIPTNTYDSFAKLIKILNSKGGDEKPRCSVITFNYDVALDYAMRYNDVLPDYCLERRGASPGSSPLLKLHGSLNWGKCSIEKCGTPVPWEIDRYVRAKILNRTMKAPGRPVKFHIAFDLKDSELKHCDRDIISEPVLVPPTWNKTEHHRVIEKVWQRAAKELSEAQHIFISGYSLPDSDLFFQYFFALGAVGAPIIKTFKVFDKAEKGGLVDERFRKLIGTAVRDRYDYRATMFQKAILEIGAQFLIDASDLVPTASRGLENL